MTANKEPRVEIEELIGEIQTGIAKAQEQLSAEQIPLLKSVTLDLVAEARMRIDGGFEFIVVTLGGYWERASSQEIEVTLKPPKPPKLLRKRPRPRPGVADQLANAIVAAGRGVQKAGSNTNVPLVATALKVVLTFVVRAGISAGLKFELQLVTAKLAGQLEKSATHQVTVLFEDP